MIMGTLSLPNTASWKRALIWRRDGIPLWRKGIHDSPKGYAGLIHASPEGYAGLGGGGRKIFRPYRGDWEEVRELGRMEEENVQHPMMNGGHCRGQETRLVLFIIPRALP